MYVYIYIYIYIYHHGSSAARSAFYLNLSNAITNRHTNVNNTKHNTYKHDNTHNANITNDKHLV